MRKVRDIVQTNVVTVRPETPVHELVKLLVRHRISGVPVIGDFDEPVGVVSATDVLALVVQDRKLVGIVTTFDLLQALASEEEPEATACQLAMVT